MNSITKSSIAILGAAASIYGVVFAQTVDGENTVPVMVPAPESQRTFSAQGFPLPINFGDVSEAPVETSQDGSDGSIWIDAPIYFASDRRQSEHRLKNSYSHFGNDQMVGQHFCQFGVAHVALKLPSAFAKDTETLRRVGYRRIASVSAHSSYYSDLENQLLRTAPAISVSMNGNPGSSPWNLAPQWLEHYAKAAATVKDTSIPIFVHGCCVSRKSSFEQAAIMQLYLRKPIILFDWATVGTFDAPLVPEINAYRRSERALDISRLNFRCFMDQVVKRFGAGQIDVLGHSMGNRLIVDLLDGTSEHFGQVHFVRPDVNLQAYLLNENRIVSRTKKSFVYYAQNDPWLKRSEEISAGIPRLGRIGLLMPLVSETATTRVTSATFIDVTNLRMAHSLPYDLISQLYQYDVIPSTAGKYVLEPSDPKGERAFVVKLK